MISPEIAASISENIIFVNLFSFECKENALQYNPYILMTLISL